MAQITLVVKGGTTDAFGAAQRAQLDGLTVWSHGRANGSTTLACDDTPSNVACLAEWMNDADEIIPGFGYATGTLLLYSFHRDPDDAGAI